MNKKTEKIDELIKETLSKEEAAFYDELEEQNLMGKIGEVYKGKLGWLAAIMNVVHLLMFMAFVYCIVRFFSTENTNELIKWASAGLSCLFGCKWIRTIFFVNSSDWNCKLQLLQG